MCGYYRFHNGFNNLKASKTFAGTGAFELTAGEKKYQQPDLMTETYKAIAPPDDFAEIVIKCIVNAFYFFIVVLGLYFLYKKCCVKTSEDHVEQFDTDS